MLKKRKDKKVQIVHTDSKSQKRKSIQVTDKRFWAKNETAIEEAPPVETKFPSFVEELKTRTELAEARLQEKLESLKRDNESLRNRLQKDTEKRLEREKVSLLKDFLEIVDNFELALDSTVSSNDFRALQKGVELNLKLFHRKLEFLGLEPIEPLGEAFDPEIAEAVALIPVDKLEQDQKVIEVIQKGYRKDKILLRAARGNVGNYGEKKKD